MAGKLTVMISSSARDLPEHRKQVMEACLRVGMFPNMMEHLPASDEDAIQASLGMVDESDIYLGVYAWRYGSVPAGHEVSFTEMEYDRAVERGIPRLLFIMHDEHPIKAADVERGLGAAKLDAFKQRIGSERVVNFFKSPEDLRAQVINSLSRFRERQPSAFHSARAIPTPPEAYVAHPYVLLQTGNLIGRRSELELLSHWVSGPESAVYQARILNIVAIGGMGKSALTWHWFRHHASSATQPLAGRMWWSFYESDARYENFIVRALAYVSAQSEETVLRMPITARENELLGFLDQRPFLLVLDGLERILRAYARPDATRLADDDLDEQASNVVARVRGLPASAAQSFVGKHPLRQTTDLRAGVFLRRLAGVRSTRTLISTRLYPAALQTTAGEAIPGSYPYFLKSLSAEDALALWRAFDVGGSQATLLDLFAGFDSHPLLIQALASLIANYRPAPKDFDRWRADHVDFNPYSLPLAEERKSHVLRYALAGLDERAYRVLYTIAAFRMPATYDTLTALFVDRDRLLPDEQTLDLVLTDLEDRGLLGWDKEANRYDLHPVVRGVVWSGLAQDARHTVYERLRDHFGSLPALDQAQVRSLEELTAPIELFNTLIGLERYIEAYALFRERLEEPLLYQLGASRQCIELLECLAASQSLPHLKDESGAQSVVLNMLAMAHELSGQPVRAIPLYEQSNQLDHESGNIVDLMVGLCNLSDPLLLTGEIYQAEWLARQALLLARQQENRDWEATSLQCLGLILAVRGESQDALLSVLRALKIDERIASQAESAVGHAFLAEVLLLLQGPAGQLPTGVGHQGPLQHATLARDADLAAGNRRHRVRSLRLHGLALLAARPGTGQLDIVEDELRNALIEARAIDLVGEELPVLLGLAEVRRRQDRLIEARDLLEQVWDPAIRGPYPILHADAHNALAQIERDAGNLAAAMEAAQAAYRLAWCDGAPFAYRRGCEMAVAHLQALGGAMSEAFPPFVQGQREPLTPIEINLQDEYQIRRRLQR